MRRKTKAARNVEREDEMEENDDPIRGEIETLKKSIDDLEETKRKLEDLNAKRQGEIDAAAKKLKQSIRTSLHFGKELKEARRQPLMWSLLVLFLFVLKVTALVWRRYFLYAIAEVAFLNVWRELYGVSVKYSWPIAFVAIAMLVAQL
jgi:hypothetical protein